MTSPAVRRSRFALSARLALPVGIFVTATAISLVRVGEVSYWTDEAASVSAANRSLLELWAMLQNIDAVHGAYYAVLHLWASVFGFSPAATRSLSALAIGGTCLGVFLLMRRLVDTRAGILAAAIAATLPRLTWAGIEARPAAFTALCAVWATYLLVRAWGRGMGPWVAYGAVALAGALFNIYVVLLIVAHAATTLLLRRRYRRDLASFAVVAVTAFVLVAPLALLVRSQQAQLGTSGDRSLAGIARRALINLLFLGETPSGAGEPQWFSRAWQLASVAAAVLGIALIALAVIRRTWSTHERMRVALAVLLPWLALPPIVIGIYAVLVAPVFQPRYFTFVGPAGAMLITAGLLALGRRWLRIVVVLVYLALVLVVYCSQRTDAAKNGTDWDSAATIIADQTAPGDAIYFTPRYPYGGDYAYVTARRMAVAYPQAYADLLDLTLLRTGAETASLDGESAMLEDVADDVARLDDLWVVFGTHYPEEITARDDAMLRAAGLVPTATWEGTRTVIVHYVRA